MANKTYTVVKDGETLKELKTLAAAKKLADAEGAEVFCEGAVVYTATTNSEVEVEAVAEEGLTLDEKSERYVLTAKMNVRMAPSLDAPKLAVAQAGTVVEVSDVKDDWLHLTDGTFILYAGGKFATKN